MKELMKITITFISIFLLSSCSTKMLNRIKGNRNVIEKTRKITQPFSAIKVSNGLEVFISEDTSSKIIVEADENLHNIIKTEVENNILKIYTKKVIWKSKAKKIYVSASSLQSITASSGSNVTTEDFFTAKNFEATASSGADLIVRIKTPSVTGRSSSGGNLTLIGTAENAILSASSGSDLEAFGLEVKNVAAKASSGGNVEATATQNIEAKASSGGDVEFKGNPKKIIKKSSSGGRVYKR